MKVISLAYYLGAIISSKVKFVSCRSYYRMIRVTRIILFANVHEQSFKKSSRTDFKQNYEKILISIFIQLITLNYSFN